MKHREVKRTAKLLLKDNWMAAMVTLAVSLSILLLIVNLTPLMTIFSATAIFILPFLLILFLYMPNRVGNCNWFLSLAQGEKPPISKVFDFFHGDGFGKSVRYTLLYLASTLGWAALFCSPVLAAYIYFFGEQNVLWMNWLLIAAFTFAVIWNLLRLFLVPYILSANKEVKVSQAMKMSVRYMRKNKLNLTVLLCSFIGWFVFGLLIIPILYIVPYFNTAMAVFAKSVLDEKTQTVSSQSEEYNGGIPEEISA